MAQFNQQRQWGETRPGEMYPQVEGPGNPSWERRNPIGGDLGYKYAQPQKQQYATAEEHNAYQKIFNQAMSDAGYGDIDSSGEEGKRRWAEREQWTADYLAKNPRPVMKPVVPTPMPGINPTSQPGIGEFPGRDGGRFRPPVDKGMWEGPNKRPVWRPIDRPTRKPNFPTGPKIGMQPYDPNPTIPRPPRTPGNPNPGKQPNFPTGPKIGMQPYDPNPINQDINKEDFGVYMTQYIVQNRDNIPPAILATLERMEKEKGSNLTGSDRTKILNGRNPMPEIDWDNTPKSPVRPMPGFPNPGDRYEKPSTERPVIMPVFPKLDDRYKLPQYPGKRPSNPGDRYKLPQYPGKQPGHPGGWQDYQKTRDVLKKKKRSPLFENGSPGQPVNKPITWSNSGQIRPTDNNVTTQYPNVNKSINRPKTGATTYGQNQ
jgi:hypothetical protein